MRKSGSSAHRVDGAATPLYVSPPPPPVSALSRRYLGAISALSRRPSGGPVAERRLRVRGPRASPQRRDRIRIQWRRRSGRIRILTAPRVSGTWHPMVARPPTVSRLSNWQAGRELYLADRLSQRKRDCISQIVSRRGCTRAPHTGTGASQARAALMAWAATALHRACCACACAATAPA